MKSHQIGLEIGPPEGNSECPEWVAISTGRRNTLAKTHEDGVYADESKVSWMFHGDREGGVVGPLEASRGAKVD